MLDNSSNNKRIAKNTLLLYFRMLVLMAVGLYTSRVILAALGVEDFGIYNVVGGIVTIIGFLNGTLSTASSRYVTVALGKGDKRRMHEVFSSVLLVNILLCLIVFVLSETVGLWFLYHKMVIPAERMNAAFWVFQFSVITVMQHIICVPFNATIIAHERMKAFAYIGLFDAFAKLGVAMLLTIEAVWDRLILYAILLYLISLTNQVIYLRYCYRNFPETKSMPRANSRLLKEMTTFISWSAYGSFVSVGFTQGLNILLNLFFGPAVNAARAVAVNVQQHVFQFTTNFQTAINPQLTKSVAQDNSAQARVLLIASSKYSFFLLCMYIGHSHHWGCRVDFRNLAERGARPFSEFYVCFSRSQTH